MVKGAYASSQGFLGGDRFVYSRSAFFWCSFPLFEKVFINTSPARSTLGGSKLEKWPESFGVFLVDQLNQRISAHLRQGYSVQTEEERDFYTLFPLSTKQASLTANNSTHVEPLDSFSAFASTLV